MESGANGRQATPCPVGAGPRACPGCMPDGFDGAHGISNEGGRKARPYNRFAPARPSPEGATHTSPGRSPGGPGGEVGVPGSASRQEPRAGINSRAITWRPYRTQAFVPGYSHYMTLAPKGRQTTPCPVGAGPYESGGDFECRGAPRGRPIGCGREGGHGGPPLQPPWSRHPGGNIGGRMPPP